MGGVIRLDEQKEILALQAEQGPSLSSPNGDFSILAGGESTPVVRVGAAAESEEIGCAGRDQEPSKRRPSGPTVQRRHMFKTTGQVRAPEKWKLDGECGP
ncbi:uncharacterized protein Aud_000275 [Aspergillus udagawae]|uniref:Uncharacterized protein n=1 Tax=Aspergillus udagawae TaxID=91492 RepID=A0A8E0QGT0_9EURO|nr:uncharacterized protein Aud_000275 [Aspergillus udagawae]GIC84459.1 hypothetical protein Aud_000275 [Aspergillus udagawae]